MSANGATCNPEADGCGTRYVREWVNQLCTPNFTPDDGPYDGDIKGTDMPPIDNGGGGSQGDNGGTTKPPRTETTTTSTLQSKPSINGNQLSTIDHPRPTEAGSSGNPKCVTIKRRLKKSGKSDTLLRMSL